MAWDGNVKLLGWFADANSGGTVSGSGTPNTIPLWTAASVLGDSKITQATGGTSIAFTPSANTTGSTSTFTFTNPNNTGRTTTAEVFGISYVGGTQTWATGAIATQREINLASPTYAFVGASTITDAFTFYANAPTAGANATITNGYAIGTTGYLKVNADTSSVILRSVVGNTVFGAIYVNSAPTGNNYFVASNGTTDVLINTPASTANLYLTKGNGSYYVLFNGDTTSGATATADFRTSNRTNITAGTNAPGYVFNFTGSQQWATGAVATSYGMNILTHTLSAVGASTITNAYTAYFEAPTAGTNATITNNWGIGTNGNISTTGGTISNPSGNLTLNGLTGISLRYNGGNRIVLSANDTSYVNTLTQTFNFNTATTSGSATNFTIITGANTGQTLGTNIPSFKITGATVQWAAGTLATQYFNYISASSVAFTSASTATNVYGLYVEAATAGTNATITNNYAAGFSGAIQTPYISGGTANNQTLTFKNTTGTVSSASTPYNFLTEGDISLFKIDYKTITFSPNFGSSGAASSFIFTAGSNINQTASTEINGYLYSSYSRQWATGAITTQREQYYKTVTYAAVGASTITNAYAMYIEAPTAGTNATITNNYAAGFAGNISLPTLGTWIALKEGAGGRMGQVALVAGTKAITITGVTTNSRAFLQLVTPAGVALTVECQAVCTANTLTIQANVAAGTINVNDTSTYNYIIYEPAS